jgi:hypothetical protein
VKTIAINPEILAQRLEHAAEVYDKDAVIAREANQPKLRQTFERQAHESREWANAVRNIQRLGFTDADEIELTYATDGATS